MTLAALAFAGQIADGLAYQLVAGRPGELNPTAALLGPHLLAVKVAVGLVLAIGVYALRNRPLGAWLAAAGFLGCATELAAVS